MAIAVEVVVIAVFLKLVLAEEERLLEFSLLVRTSVTTRSGAFDFALVLLIGGDTII